MDRHDDKSARPEDLSKDRSGGMAKKPDTAGHPDAGGKQTHAAPAAGTGDRDKEPQKSAQQSSGHQAAQQKPGQPLPGQQPPAKPNDDPSKRTPERQAGQQQHNPVPPRR